MKSACRILVVSFLLSLAFVLVSAHARLSLHERLQGQRQGLFRQRFLEVRAIRSQRLGVAVVVNCRNDTWLKSHTSPLCAGIDTVRDPSE